MRSEFRILPVTLYGLFWNIVVSFCLVFSLVERRRPSATAPAPRRRVLLTCHVVVLQRPSRTLERCTW